MCVVLLQSTTELIKEDVAQLKAMIKDTNQKAKADRTKKLSSLKAMITDMKQAAKFEQLIEEICELKKQNIELKKQNAVAFECLNQISSKLDVLMAASSTKLMNEEEPTESRQFTLESGSPKVSNYGNSNNDKPDD